MSFVEDQGIELVHLGIEGRKTPWKPISEEVILNALKIILEPSNYPLLIMDHMGRHRTGTDTPRLLMHVLHVHRMWPCRHRSGVSAQGAEMEPGLHLRRVSAVCR